jgi:hypothetical protein
MSLVTQPAIEGVSAEFLSAILIILAGILLESHNANKTDRKLQRVSVGLTALGLIVFMFTTKLDWLLVLPLFAYMGIGLLVALANVESLFWLFGSKTYGSLMFSMAIFHIPEFQNKVNEVLFHPQLTPEILNQFLWVYYIFLVIFWVITGIFVWIIARKIDNWLD